MQDDRQQERGSLAERVASRLAAPTAPKAIRPAVAEAAPVRPLVQVVPPAPASKPEPEREPAREAAPAAPDTDHAPAAPSAGASQPEAPAANRGRTHDINLNRLQSAGFVTPNAPPSRLTEEFRLIKRQLLKYAFPDERTEDHSQVSHVIMVTSAMPGEGKTFTSLNLAMSLSSERDLYVLLVDGDSYHHSLTEHLGVGEGPGLVDLLVDPTLEVRDVLLRTNIPNLTFLPPGRPHPHCAELLASKQMGFLMEDLAARYADRVIIIDTPPVLASSEASVLATHVGQTVVVVEKDRTGRRALERTLSMLEACPSVSCVLNMAAHDPTVAAYGYYGYAPHKE